MCADFAAHLSECGEAVGAAWAVAEAGESVSLLQ
jgi:hypothetical protein